MQLSAKRWAVFIFPQPSKLERGKKYKTAIVVPPAHKLQ
jgi:hypothetical protein